MRVEDWGHGQGLVCGTSCRLVLRSDRRVLRCCSLVSDVELRRPIERWG